MREKRMKRKENMDGMDGAAAAAASAVVVAAAACRATPSESEPKVADGIFAELENTFADVVPRRHTHTQYTTPAAERRGE